MATTLGCVTRRSTEIAKNSSTISCVRPSVFTPYCFSISDSSTVGEFDDSALMKAFGQRGAGVFIGPTVLEAEIETQYGVKTLGRTLEIVEEFFAISVERRVTHPSVVAITAAAKDRLFVTSDDA